jgi:hypothetical protein
MCRTGDCYRRWRWAIWLFVVIQMLAVCLWFWVGHAVAQTLSQETINVNTSYQVTELYRRINDLEGQGSKSVSTIWELDARLRLLEHDMQEVKFFSRSIAVAVIGQLAIAGMGFLRKKAEDN